MLVEGRPPLDRNMRRLLVLHVKPEPDGGLRAPTSLVIALGVARAKVRVATKSVPEPLVTVATGCARGPQRLHFDPQACTARKGHGAEPPAAVIPGGRGAPRAVDGGQGSAAFQVWVFKKIILPVMVHGTHAHFREFRRF